MIKIKQALPSLTVIALLLGIWWWVVVATESVIFPTPGQVVIGTIELIKDGTLWEHIYSSLFRVGTGFLLAVLIAVPLGLWMGWVKALGNIRLKPFILRWGRWLTIEWDEIVRAERWFGTRGWLIVGVGRLLPTVRSIVSVPAGLLKMRFLTFTIASSVGTALWTALLAGAGYLMGARYHDIDRVIGPVANGVIVAILALYAVRLWRGRKVVASFD